MAIKEGVSYDEHRDNIEGFGHGQTGKLANHAHLFMVGGFIYKWKLPIAYYLSSGPMVGSAIN